MNREVDLKKIQKNLLLHLNELVKCVLNTEMPDSLITKKITSSEIKNESFVREFSNPLLKSESHIYWIEVDKPSVLVERFNNRSTETIYKCARNNKEYESKFVYVGSCTKTKLGDRFIQHCGWGNDQTYSLQLRKWLTDDELIFTFTWVSIKDSLVAQYIEDQLHRELRPLFGKPGGNNKLKAVN